MKDWVLALQPLPSECFYSIAGATPHVPSCSHSLPHTSLAPRIMSASQRIDLSFPFDSRL